MKETAPVLIIGLSVRLGGRSVLDELSMEVMAGDCVALLGGNGAGKTTVLRAIMGFVRRTKGEIFLFGESVAGKSGREQRRRVAYVPQVLALDFKMPVTVRDLVSMGRYVERGLCRNLRAEDWAAVDKALADAGIQDLADRPLGHLSGGERQKAQIARALCQSPDLLLLDEPTSNLDLGAQHECLDLIAEIHERRSMTTIIVMHDLQALPTACNRAIILEAGRKAFDGRFSDIFTREHLFFIYKQRADNVLAKLPALDGGGLS